MVGMTVVVREYGDCMCLPNILGLIGLQFDVNSGV